MSETVCLFCQRVVKTRLNRALGTFIYATHNYAGANERCPGSGSVVPPAVYEQK